MWGPLGYQRPRSMIPLNQLAQNSFDNKQMRFFKIWLKACTQAHTKHSTRPTSSRVKQGSNHTLICFDINFFTKYESFE